MSYNTNVAEAIEVEDFAMDDFDMDESFSDDPETADIKIAVSNLKRMYPTVKDIPFEPLSKFIVWRTMAYMLHMDQKFDMNSTFDENFFEKMKKEAVIYMNWVYSDDDTIPPELIYKSSTPPSEISDEDADAPHEESHVVTEKKVSKRGNSNYQLGLKIYRDDIREGKQREYTVNRMVQELGMEQRTANVYYSKYKHER